MEQEEMTNIIYDTLMGNKQHPQFDPDKVTEQEVNCKEGFVAFLYDGTAVSFGVEAG